MNAYGIVIEKGKKGESFSAFVPDLPGCVAAAKTLAGVRKLIAEAIAGHVEMMREEEMPVPAPTTICETAPAYRRARRPGRVLPSPARRASEPIGHLSNPVKESKRPR